MSFEVDVVRHLGQARIAARFSTSGGLTALHGPSGVGKSSVLNMIAGLLRPEAGRIVVAGETLFDATRGVNLPPERRRLGYVFQEGRLFPHMSVRDNLLYGGKGVGGGDPAAFEETVEALGIASLLHRRPTGLSGGEMRRVAIGRALLSAPRALLMDEPLSGVDPARREDILSLVERLRDRFALPILYVSHDQAEVKRLAGTVVEMSPVAPAQRP